MVCFTDTLNGRTAEARMGTSFKGMHGAPSANRCGVGHFIQTGSQRTSVFTELAI